MDSSFLTKLLEQPEELKDLRRLVLACAHQWEDSSKILTDPRDQEQIVACVKALIAWATVIPFIGADVHNSLPITQELRIILTSHLSLLMAIGRSLDGETIQFSQYLESPEIRQLKALLLRQEVTIERVTKQGQEFKKNLLEVRTHLKVQRRTIGELREAVSRAEDREKQTEAHLVQFQQGAVRARQSGHKRGFNEGILLGHTEGHAEGLAQGLARGLAQGLQQGEAKGHAHGLKQGQAKGRTQGRAQGLAEGKTEGFAEGQTQGFAKGQAQGFAKGQAQGFAEGLAEGRTQGFAKGHTEGLAEGHVKKLTQGPLPGLTQRQPHPQDWQKGFEAGFKKSQAQNEALRLEYVSLQAAFEHLRQASIFEAQGFMKERAQFRWTNPKTLPSIYLPALQRQTQAYHQEIQEAMKIATQHAPSYMPLKTIK